MDNESSPDIWIQFMRKGAFEKAWNFSDSILKSGINRDYYNVPRHFQCIWDGKPLSGKRVFIRCYHGLGDTIQFIRYAEMVKEIASEVIVWAQPALLGLLRTVKGIDRLLPLHDGIPEAEFDVDVELMELPHVFRTTLSSIPSKVPYLHVDPLLISEWDKKFSVGLVWQAGDWDQSRNVPFGLIRQLTEAPNAQLYILQENAETAGWEKGFGVCPGKFTLYDYARIIKGLDLLITIDSMPAHLAGSLNVPVWVMLKSEADWRWMENRTDSPWYPSMKVFRQEQPGEWEGVVEKIVEELRALV